MQERGAPQGQEKGSAQGKDAPVEKGKGQVQGKDAPADKGKGQVQGKDAPAEKGKGQVQGKDAPSEKGKGQAQGKDAPAEKGKGQVQGKDAPAEKGKAQQGAGGGSMTAEQRTTIRETVISKGPRVTSVNFSVSVGTVIPRTVTLVVLPAAFIEIYPQYRGRRYFVYDEQIIIVDDDFKIIAIITV